MCNFGQPHICSSSIVEEQSLQFRRRESLQMIATARKATTSNRKGRDLAMRALLAKIVKGKTLLKLPQDAALFSQGELADAIYFVQTGKVRLTVVSPQKKKAVLATMGPRDFLGEECLVDGARRTSTATTMDSSTVFRITKRAMLQAIHLQPAVAKEFVTALLARNVDIEEDLCDQLFNHSEQRLACILLKMSRKGRHVTKPDVKVAGVTHKKLAKIIGTTPAKIIFFMHKFRSLGLIDYKGDGDVKVMPEQLTDMILRA
jgi:CRP/FNR family cyclic AMP-dependent transcriptional regulator